jgi:selenocysteine insertion sequence-binding protein 2
MLLQANMRRWYVCGLREVRKAIKSGKARAVLLAPNIEQIEAEGALNDSVDDIISSCGAADVPVVFALSRKKMGEVYGFRKRMSAIALLEVGGVQEVFEQVLSLAADGRRRWVECHPEQAAADAAAAVAAAAAAQLASEGLTSGEGDAGPAAAAAAGGVSTNGSAAASAAVAAASTAAGVAASSSSGS